MTGVQTCALPIYQGISGIAMELVDEDGNSFDPAKTTASGNNGAFSFAGVAAGSYKIKTTATADYEAYTSDTVITVTTANITDQTITLIAKAPTVGMTVAATNNGIAAAGSGNAYTLTGSRTADASLHVDFVKAVERHRLGYVTVNFTGLENNKTYTVKQTNPALKVAYPDEFAGGVKTKDYTTAELTGGYAVLVLQDEQASGDDKANIVLELSETAAEGTDATKLATLTLTNNTTMPQPAWVTVDGDITTGELATTDQKAYTATLTDSTTNAIDRTLFAGVANDDHKFGQCIIKFGALDKDTTYTITQTNPALTKAYNDSAFPNNTKTEEYTSEKLADGLAFLVLQGETGQITFDIKVKDSVDALRTFTFTNSTSEVKPTITLGTMPTVTASDNLITADASGKITGFTDTGAPAVDVTLTKGSKDYQKVRLVVEVTEPNDSTNDAAQHLSLIHIYQ